MNGDGAIGTNGERHAAELLELGDAFFELDRDWRIVRVNRRQEELSRRPREETVGRTFAEVWPELATPASRYWREYQRCMSQRVPVQFQDYYAPLDLWTGVTAYPISGGGIAVFFRDITATKHAEREQVRLAAIVESTDDAIIAKDLQGVIVTWNAGAERLFGYAASEAIGRSIDMLLPGDRRGEEDRILAELRAGRRVEHFDTRRLRKDGTVVEVSVTVSPLRDESGEVVGASKIARDVTERARAAEALRESEEKFRSLYESASVGLGRVALDGRFIEVNGAYAAILGRSREELLALTLRDVVHPDDLAAEAERLAALSEGRLPSYRAEQRYLRKDGVAIWVSQSVGLARDQDGEPAYCAVVAEDVTERKRAEAALRAANERLREADQRKDEFLGMLSHELRNPLAPIRNALYILERAEPGGRQARRAEQVAVRQLGYLTRLVDDLLDVTRIARGRIELRRAPLDLAALGRRTAEDHRALMLDRGIELSVEVPDRPVPVSGDETRLAQVIGNLLQNAAKFTPGGGRVALAVEAEDGVARLRVRDTGAGIEPGMQETIFEPFTQAKQTLARSEGGLGLGLALVKGLVALHGGEVSASSAGPGHGAEFAVTLPLTAPWAEAGDAPPPRGAPRGAGVHRVLVVDDNRDAADSLAELVQLFGHRVEVAYDGSSALGKASAQLPDIVLCDIGLPGMDGYEVARQLRALSPDHVVRLVAVSGYAQPDDVTRAKAAGFDAHIPKPPDPARLAALLE